MTLQNQVFPYTESYGSSGGPSYRTDITRARSGAEERISRWSSPLHRYDLVHDIRGQDTIYNILNWWNAHKGAGVGFLFKDWFDYASTADGKTLADNIGAANPANNDQLLGTGDGVETSFQLRKTYTVGSQSTVRNITKPKSGTVIVSKDTGGGPVTQTLGVDYTLDTNNGQIDFTSAPAGGDVIRAGFEFYVPVRFDPDAEEQLAQHARGMTSSAITSLPLIEIQQSTMVESVPYMGEATNLGDISADTAAGYGFGLCVRANPQSGGLKVKLSKLTDFAEDGGPIYKIFNEHASNALTVADDGGTAITGTSSIAGGKVGLVYILRDSSNTRYWKMAVSA